MGYSVEEVIALLDSADHSTKAFALQFLIRNLSLTGDTKVREKVDLLLRDDDVTIRFWARKLAECCERLERKEEELSQGKPAAYGDELPAALAPGDLDRLFSDLVKAATGKDGVEILKEILTHDSPGLSARLVEYLKGCRDVVQVSFLTKQIGLRYPSPETLVALAPYLTHEDDRVVANTIEGIETSEDPKVVALFAQLLNHRSHRVRGNAAQAISRFDPEAARGVVSKMIGMRERPNFVIAACHAAKQMKDRSFLPALLALTDDTWASEEATGAILALVVDDAFSEMEKLLKSRPLDVRADSLLKTLCERAEAIRKGFSKPDPGLKSSGAGEPGNPNQGLFGQDRDENRIFDFQVLERKILALEEAINLEQGQAMALENRIEAFGLFSRIIYRPQESEISLIYSETRYEPFWDVRFRTFIDYSRLREAVLPTDKPVAEVKIGGQIIKATDGKVRLSLGEHCSEESCHEVFIDACSGKRVDLSVHAANPKHEIGTPEELHVADLIVLPAKVKASVIMRELLAEFVKPVKADEINGEKITIERLNLMFRPIHAFEFQWGQKTAVLEIDALTGAISAGRAVKERFQAVFSTDKLFEIGSEVFGLVVPGGEIALRLARAVMKKG